MRVPEHPGDLLSALLDGELTAEEAATIRAHVAGCAACAAELDSVREARRLVRELPAVEPPDGFLDGLLAPAQQDASAVVPLAGRAPGRRRGRGVAAASVAAATVAVVIAAPWRDDQGTIEPDLAVAIEQHASTVGALEDDGVLSEAPQRLQSSQPVPPTTAARQSLAEMDDAFDAPREIAGYELVEAYDAGDGVHLLYRRGSFGLSVFERKGEVDFAALPDGGTRIRVGDHRAWRWDDLVADGRLVVIDGGGVVFTIAGDEPGEVVLDVARALVSG